MKIFFAAIANLILISVFGQTTNNNNCISDDNPRTKITKLTYPFSKAEKIIIVRYKATAVQGKTNLFSWDTVSFIPLEGKNVDTTKFLTKKLLTNNGIDSLLKIINQRSKTNLSIEGIFVEPSNAILFIDKSGNIFDYIVICFAKVDNQIEHTEMTSSPKINLGQWCSEKGKMLLDFFQQRGVEPVVTLWE